ncbi:MAG TPA: class II D-tagatose-bisphosphate aldolase, non-catalytic subunit [Dongiaceae bacterium]|nr:class II D-tagatose-bisphosphate aldolase, non-catalytic subunit [Dongiaceae bacterium]
MTTQSKSNSQHAVVELERLLKANRQGKATGIFAICSANRFVLEAGMLQAKRDGSLLLIEATSNQVNQFGGYTGQTPQDFVQFVQEIARSMKMPWNRVVLGGDHLGPHVWRNTSSKAAMEKARELVQEYVRAGFTKIHLDTSMPCADDGVAENEPLAEEVVNERAAELCEASEAAFQSMRGSVAAPRYVIGTEVPIPGGEQSGAQAPQVTICKNLGRTLDQAEGAFQRRGLGQAWKRVVAIVVQPGVEFGDATVFHYDAKKAKALSRYGAQRWSGVYEAHSTDYQTTGALRQMVKDHFAILKVGPWLTFAFREAIFALEAIEKEMICARADIPASGVQQALEDAMLQNPVYWKGYYHGGNEEMRFARRFSYSDRVRYYWPLPKVSTAVQRLIANLTTNPAPLSLLSQYLPQEAEAVRDGRLTNRPEDLIRHKVLEVIDHYSYACGNRKEDEAAC